MLKAYYDERSNNGPLRFKIESNQRELEIDSD